MKYTITYTTIATIAHDLPAFTHTCETLAEALAWIDNAVEFLKGVDDVFTYEVTAA